MSKVARKMIDIFRRSLFRILIVNASSRLTIVAKHQRNALGFPGRLELMRSRNGKYRLCFLSCALPDSVSVVK